MSYAKYAEDDLEIQQDRIAWQQFCLREWPADRNDSSTNASATYSWCSFSTEYNPEGLYRDRHISCRMCGKYFVHTAHSQEIFAKKGWQAPKRCKKCRKMKGNNHKVDSALTV